MQGSPVVIEEIGYQMTQGISPAHTADLERRFNWTAAYLDDQAQRRQQEREVGWPLLGTLRRVEVFQVGEVRVIRLYVGLR